jgi:hypothetical protein
MKNEPSQSDAEVIAAQSGQLAKSKAWIIGLCLLSASLICVIVSLVPGRSATATEVLRALSLHLGTAGIVIMTVEVGLRIETANLVRTYVDATLRTTLGTYLGNVDDAIKSTLTAGIQGQISALTVEVTSTIDNSLEAMLLSELRNIREAVLQNAANVIVRAKVGKDTGREKRLSNYLVEMMDSLEDVRTHGDWAKEVYRAYLDEVLHNVRDTVKALCVLSVEKRGSVSRQWIKFVAPEERTNLILMQLVSTLPDGGEYRVISNVESWCDDKLDGFFKKSLEAVLRGVAIRRVFVVFRDDVINRLDDVVSVLTTHLDAASDGYEIRLLDASTDVASRKYPDLSEKHYGIFIPGDHEEHYVMVKVDSTKLTQLSISNVNKESDEVTTFRRIWESLGNRLTPDLLADSVERWRATRASRIRDAL